MRLYGIYIVTEGQAPLDGGGAGGDEGEEVRINDAFVIDAADFGVAGGEDSGCIPNDFGKFIPGYADIGNPEAFF